MENNTDNKTSGSRYTAGPAGDGIREFAENVRERLQRRYGERYRVEVKDTLKNNGLRLTGLCISETSGQYMDIAPVIYLDGYYAHGLNAESTCRAVMELRGQCAGCGCFDTSAITDFGKARERICCRLVNADANRELLATLPHRPYLDMAVVYYMEMGTGTETTATANVTDSIMRAWGVDEETLYGLASRNTPELLGFRLTPIMDKLKGLTGTDTEALERVGGNGPEMYVASNRSGHFGACVMLRKEVLEWFAGRTGRSFYILPSSIHETIFLPVRGGEDTEALGQMVREINAKELEPEEILSDHVYYYSTETGDVSIVA